MRCPATIYGVASACEKRCVLHERYAFALFGCAPNHEVAERVLGRRGAEHAKANLQLKTSVFESGPPTPPNLQNHHRSHPLITPIRGCRTQFIVITWLDPAYPQL
jgi:hypothetical protein